jgi:hypothetical protein
MSDFENFKTMLSHGFPSNKVYSVKEETTGHKNKIIEKKRVHINGLKEDVVYEQFIFNENGEFISWQTSSMSVEEWEEFL